jgi:hypothetical protein
LNASIIGSGDKMVENAESKNDVQILSLGKLGMSLLVISFIIVAVVAFIFPSFQNIFNVTILKTPESQYVNLNILIRLYAGFLVSSALMYLVQFILWVLVKASIGLRDYTANLKQVTSVRTFSVVAVALLFAALFLFGGMQVVRL